MRKVKKSCSENVEQYGALKTYFVVYLDPTQVKYGVGGGCFITIFRRYNSQDVSFMALKSVWPKTTFSSKSDLASPLEDDKVFMEDILLVNKRS